MEIHRILLCVISAFISASVTILILYKRGELFIPHIENIWEKDIYSINKYINKHIEYLRTYFSYNALTFGLNKECADIVNVDNKHYIKFRYAPFGLFGRSIEQDLGFETAYERIIQEHFIDMDTFLVVDEETELLLNIIK